MSKPTERDKQTQIILQSLDPHEHFEDVMFALKGMDYPEEILLDWMETSGYDQRSNHNEREKINRFRSACTMAEAQESGYHARGFNTIRNLYLEAGYDKLDLQIKAANMDDDDVEYVSGDYTKIERERKVERFTQYHKLVVEPRPLPVQTLTLNQQYQTYLKTLFLEDDLIYGTVNIFQGGGSMPCRNAMQDPESKPEYINVNPTTGDNGDDNVADFRFTLIECDDVESLEEQYAMLLATKLPIKTITDSGGKSLHALVHVNASNVEEYRERVSLIREFCKGVGINYDTRCSDPSRYTRCAGAIRKLTKPVKWRSRHEGEYHEQTLIDTNVGVDSFLYWKLVVYPKYINYV